MAWPKSRTDIGLHNAVPRDSKHALSGQAMPVTAYPRWFWRCLFSGIHFDQYPPAHAVDEPYGRCSREITLVQDGFADDATLQQFGA